MNQQGNRCAVVGEIVIRFLVHLAQKAWYLIPNAHKMLRA
ncbi:hypothetical protein HMPREF1991_02879 [Hoylesella loescheii DSM 19665 = JCM 12249 = ATCC 15930]|uniref:Uncharacterized protein n=1 Tax=Hoylesella loescheii DSM 19665 = JCM 12249 = ATCC 15930 TaxID=1122985 RepID=A0A069QMI4_HOYLO|nr:hypothetical protein HMPREF1991_02879 [Hoylesella loescheii DSM 19665 = JCM 12249 = ATCC 15930]